MKVLLINPPRENEIIGNNKHTTVFGLHADFLIKRSI